MKGLKKMVFKKTEPKKYIKQNVKKKRLIRNSIHR